MSGTIPSSANWDMTYACQLRCTHCYSESGRRASRRLPREDMLRIADTILAMGIKNVQLSGGEPLLVEELPEIAARLAAGGVRVALYTNGLLLNDDNARAFGELFDRIHVSLDGATAAVHDRIRGRAGAFEGALRGLGCLDRAAAERKAAGKSALHYGFETVVVQSNFHQLDDLCAQIAPRFPHLGFVRFGAAVPSGLANDARYAVEELLSDAQLAALRDPALAARLRALLPASVTTMLISDLFFLMMDPERIARGQALTNLLHIEPDGAVRSMAIYEGTVGNLLHDPPWELWQRVLDRHSHPLVRRELASVESMPAWAAASRRIDWHFAAPEERARIAPRVLGEGA
ncbi:radical SAM protein [Polyangium aurulentum]|uniref:radical SAM protein n=1 Tax=Polyangium aurulentum TaxID=2567896 RepID=UPI0010AE5DF4|nr:radical SAM protein [Polyangium aurulentum]UQA57320.1 radical SAM protein [Polyangium aurulentum]